MLGGELNMAAAFAGFGALEAKGVAAGCDFSAAAAAGGGLRGAAWFTAEFVPGFVGLGAAPERAPGATPPLGGLEKTAGAETSEVLAAAAGDANMAVAEGAVTAAGA